MINYKKHLLLSGTPIKQALIRLDELAKDAILFVVDSDDKLIGSLTDGDVRRGLIHGISIDSPVDSIIQPLPKFLTKDEYDIKKVISYRTGNFRILPILNKEGKIINVLNFRETLSYLPVDAVIMAGGKGERLMPMTASTPKSLLKVGNKPIMEHNIDRLTLYGVCDYWIALNYLGEQIESHFGDGDQKNIKINYIKETLPLGTIGAVAGVENFIHDYVLVMNADLLTNIDYEHFFLDFIEKDADFSVVTIPYKVTIPYAVLETKDRLISNFIEKPTYTYYSNGGIYLMKKSVLSHLPVGKFYNATDLLEKLIQDQSKVISYPLSAYWLDIGKPDDFKKAQEDIKNIKF